MGRKACNMTRLDIKVVMLATFFDATIFLLLT